MARLTTRFIREPPDLVEHFDRLAPEYFDAHGPAERLLAYRLAIIRRFLATARMGTLLEIGCGTAIHLLPLAGRFGQAHGIDVSPEMAGTPRSRRGGPGSRSASTPRRSWPRSRTVRSTSSCA